MVDDKKLRELGEKPVLSLLMQYAVPAIVAMVASSLYNIIDGVFIGQGVGPGAIMGLALTLPVMNISAAFGAMVGVGGSTLMSVKLGEKDYKIAQNILGNVITMNVIVGLGLGLLMIIFLNPILRFFGASDYTLPYARDFLIIILAGNVFTHLYLGLNAMMRSAGKPRQAMYATIMTVVINAMLAPLFIFLFEWGIRGAALATVTAQVIVLLWQFKLLSNPEEFIHLRKGTYKLKGRIVKGSLSIGMSPFLINLCACFVVIIINRSLVSYGGDTAVGAYGIANRISFFFVMVVIGINQGMQPIAGYNYGARNFNRLTSTLRYAAIFATIVVTLAFLMAMFAARPCVQAFTSDPELIDKSAHALKMILLVSPVIGIQIVTSGFFQSIGEAKKSIFLSLTRQLLFLIPALLVLPHFLGLDGVWLSIPFADLVSTITAVIMLAQEAKKFKRSEKEQLSAVYK